MFPLQIRGYHPEKLPEINKRTWHVYLEVYSRSKSSIFMLNLKIEGEGKTDQNLPPLTKALLNGV